MAGDRPLSSDPALCDLLTASARPGDHRGRIASTDLFYDGSPSDEQRWRDAGAVAVEMETATLFALARRRSLRAGSVLLVSDLLAPSRVRIEDEALHEGERRLGRVAAEALSRV